MKTASIGREVSKTRIKRPTFDKRLAIAFSLKRA